jgi:ribonuclease HII
MAVNFEEEERLYNKGYQNIAGLDESGVGSFAGDVYMAAVILPPDIDYKTILPGLNDSKKKTAEQREKLYTQIKKHALAYSIGTASVEEIDEINIYWAKFLAARRAISQLSTKPDYILIDGNKEVPEIDISQKAIVKGDGKSVSIAAASILAKVERDRHILELAELVHEDYNWKNNKSYYCVKQIEAIKKYGKTKWHREKYVSKYLKNDSFAW